jgi:glycosyltransferase involved in cell wall biosynthesis
MKVLHIIESLTTNHGGIVVSTTQISKAMQACGASVDILNLDDPRVTWGEGFCEHVHRLGPPRSTYAYAPRLKQWLSENLGRYEAAIVHGIWRHHSAAVASAGRALGVPYYVVPHGMLSPWLNRGLSAKQLKKHAVWLALESRAFRHARAVIYNSDEERSLASLSYWPYRCREVVLPFGVSEPPAPGAWDVRAEFPELAGKRIFLSIGRLHPQKACDQIIEAFARAAAPYPDIQLVMAGPDNYGWRAELENLASRLGIARRITWTGLISHDRKWDLIRASELVLQPSHCESVGYANVEAIACGVPVVVSDRVNTHRQLLEDGCAIVCRNTTEETARAMREWLVLPIESRRKMSDAARSCYLRRFEGRRAAASLIEFLESELRTRAARN